MSGRENAELGWQFYLRDDELEVVKQWQDFCDEIYKLKRKKLALKADYMMIQNRCSQRLRYANQKTEPDQ